MTSNKMKVFFPQMKLCCFLLALRFAWCLLPQYGYIHPDEFFQTVEIVAGVVVYLALLHSDWDFCFHYRRCSWRESAHSLGIQLLSPHSQHHCSSPPLLSSLSRSSRLQRSYSIPRSYHPTCCHDDRDHDSWVLHWEDCHKTWLWREWLPLAPCFLLRQFGLLDANIFKLCWISLVCLVASPVRAQQKRFYRFPPVDAGCFQSTHLRGICMRSGHKLVERLSVESHADLPDERNCDELCDHSLWHSIFHRINFFQFHNHSS